MLELAIGVAFGVEIGGLLQLQGTFTSDGVVDATAEEEEVAGCGVVRGDGARGVEPALELALDGGGKQGELGELLLEGGGVKLTPGLGGQQREQVQIEDLRGEALSGRYGTLSAGKGFSAD